MVNGMKSVLITGCSAGGIGDALCQEFISNDWRVFATARNITKVQHLKASGCDILELDVTDEASVKAAAAQVIVDTDGTLDMLINSAGRGMLLIEGQDDDISAKDYFTVYTGTVLDSDIREVRETFETNVIGVVSVTKTFAPLLLKSKGTIVNIGSMTGFIPGPYCSSYGGSKAALELLSHAMRQEMEPLGLKVVHVSCTRYN
jgi:NAD(P)-dependent dehydrogenase (short-subunit alcohol dehydrogenase family)